MKKVLFSFLVCVVASSACVFAEEWVDQALIEAVRNEDGEKVRELIANGANPSYMYGEDNALMIACSKQNLEIVKLLLACRDANASAKNANGQTALMIAARDCNNLAILRLLISQGRANVNDKDNAGVTVFMYAMKNSDVNVIKFMLDQNITNINATDNTGSTAAMWAAKLNKPQAIKSLAKNGMDVDWTTTNNNNDNVLSLAIKTGNLELVKVLLKEVPDFDVDMKMGNGEPTLFWAIRSNKSTKLIEYLISQYDPEVLLDTTDDDGNNIEKIAKKYGKGMKNMLLRKIKEAKEVTEP